MYFEGEITEEELTRRLQQVKNGTIPNNPDARRSEGSGDNRGERINENNLIWSIVIEILRFPEFSLKDLIFIYEVD